MKISQDWIREYVAVDLPRQELVDRLTMIGWVPETVEEKDGDLILDLETYANRPDTLGHLGVARELGALLRLPLLEKDWPVAELDEETAAVADVQIAAEALCPRYCGLVVRGVPVGPSPEWMRRRLEAVGLRPINNIVDVSNYVLFATGQPLHTFDFGRIGGGRIVVREAKRGETLVDLDGRTLALEPGMLVIADESRPVALAGIIGGQASGISESTRDVFIESACFDPIGIRKTAKKLGLATDASYRFERGADIGFAPQGARMAASLLTQMGGRASRGLIDCYPRPPKALRVRLRLRRVAELLGVVVPEEFVVDVLGRLGFRLEPAAHHAWRVDVPTFRVDVSREADLVEEVARFYGYDRIPPRVTPVDSFPLAANRSRERLARIRQALLGQGFDEVINWSFADPEREAAAAGGRTPVAIQNPFSNRASVMRTTLLPGLVENAAWNLNRGLEGVHVFETGNVYYWVDEKKHREDLHLGLLSTGLRPGAGPSGAPAEADFFTVKGAVEAALEALRFDPVVFEERDHPSFEPGSALAVLYRGQAVGFVGTLRAAFTAGASVERPVIAGEIDLSALFGKTPRPFEFVPVPKFPGVVRDFSFLVDRAVPYGDAARILGRLDQPLLEGFELVDRFAGPPVPEGRVSLTIRLRFRHPQRTLVAGEVDKAAQEIIGHLKAALDIQLREGIN
ncbi:MAG TPA: phenylalanine--tRNA ligase subunit beta [Candidatus Aminicenantes bacterium]|nr:phenylalanine--tRNA ligase subunit beta [Candidatus Aminicenantes bacterium]HRY64116.1 phenylalanine--tRNA ligase subunit beta [Candidatus Aminicenantes bacterium]HRZ71029.1 phenylalanine--tRNA ligase subunit beta [Candidatus Aminicenantes bacterium]